MTKKTCLITGVGPGTGSALARRFAAGGYQIAMIARNQDRLSALEQELPDSRGYICEMSDEQAVNETVAKISKDMGAPQIVFHNAVRGTFGNFLEMDPKDLNTNFQINTMGLLYLARAVAPPMIDRCEGVILDRKSFV